MQTVHMAEAARSLGYPVPPEETARLRALLGYECPDGITASGLDAICRLAKDLFDVPIAFVTLIGSDALTFVAETGLGARQAPRADSFCCHTILSDEVLVVPDAREDARFAALPVVTGAPFLRFYAGAPLVAEPGLRVGTLCICDVVARPFGAAEAERLRGLAGLALTDLRQRRLIYDLKREHELLSLTARMAKVGSWTWDMRTRSLFWSAEAHRIFEVGPETTPTRQLVETLLSGTTKAAIEAGIAALIHQGTPFSQVFPITTAKGRSRWIRCVAEAERSGGEITRLTGSLQDITAQRLQAAEVERLAYSDMLTGLPNRALFQTRFAAALAAASQNGTKVGLMMIDIDHFKTVNDTLGHDAGDALLATVASQLQAACRGGDTVARLSGDEFVIVFPDLGSVHDLRGPTARILELLRTPLDVNGKSLSATASIGIALYPDDDLTPAGLLKSADIALYRAKYEGRDRVVVFDGSMRRRAAASLADPSQVPSDRQAEDRPLLPS